MANFNIFSPLGANKTISVSGSSANVALDMAGESRAIRFVNDLDEVVFIVFGINSAVAATTGGMAIAAGATEVFEAPQKATHVAAISGGGSGNLYIVEGQGA
jgi:hypothetical protein